MYSLDLQWKKFSVDLQSVEAAVKIVDPKCIGNTAADKLTFYFSEQPSDEVIAEIRAYWDSLAPDSVEAKAHVPQSAIEAAIQAAKASAVTKSWDAMSVAERKIVMGMTPTKQELGL